MFSTRPATVQDIDELFPTLLPVSVKELSNVGLANPITAMLAVLTMSDTAFSLLDDEAVVGMWGVTRTGYFWGFLGVGIKPIYKSLIQYSQDQLPALLTSHGEIKGETHEDNKFVLRWVSLLGFEVTGPHPYEDGLQNYYGFNKCASQWQLPPSS